MTETSLASLNGAHGTKLKVAVLIPCYNEASTVTKVVSDFKAALPDATIYVYDNNSTDGTFDIALTSGAIVRRETQQGKGNVVRRMFRDIEADIYILVDGDATYDASAAPELVKTLLSGPYDKVNGARVHMQSAAYRPGHVLGNKAFTQIVASLFGAKSKDMLSGYKALSRRFVKTFPSASAGFEIETELLIHALELSIPMAEIDTFYGERPAGSMSKLSTFRDGFRILWLIIHLVRDLMPLRFFSYLAVLFVAISLILGLPVVSHFLQTGLVPRLPTAVAALGFMILGSLSLFAGLILDSVARGRKETKLLSFLSFPSVLR